MTESREFAATTYSESVSGNAKRMADTLAPLTITAYESRWKTFVNAQSDKSGLPAKLQGMVNELKQKAIAKELSWSSVRLYKATICYGLTMTYLAKFHPTSAVYIKLKDTANFSPLKGLTFDNSLDKRFFEELYADIKDFTLTSEDKGEAVGGKTSSTKAKSISKDIYNIILGSNDYAGTSYALLREFIELNCIIGLRPIEWFDLQGMTKRHFDANIDQWFEKLSKADVEVLTHRKTALGRDNIHKGLFDIPEDASVILIKNGKNSLGRAGIEYRVLYSSDKDFYKRVTTAQKRLIAAAEQFANTKKKEDGDSSFIDEAGKANVIAFSQIMRFMQRKMRYIVGKDAGIQSIIKKSHNKMLSQKKFSSKMDDAAFSAFKEANPMKSPTIYSTRHQAVANAKEAGMSPVAIAAMFGHSSVITAARHYGKAVSGTGASKLRPSDRNIDSVLLGVTEDQMRVLVENTLTKGPKTQKVKTNESTQSYDGFNP